jgi:trans-aconitate methyltransferase
VRQVPWRFDIDQFHNPYFFYGIEEYESWLQETGFKVNRLELVPKDMTHPGKAGLLGWIRTTWMPITQQISKDKQEDFINRFVDRYLERFPLDEQGLVHVRMVRLEVDAIKNSTL